MAPTTLGCRDSVMRVHVISAADQCGRDPLGAVSVGALDQSFELSENRAGGRPSRDADPRERTVGREHGPGSTMWDLFSAEVGSL